MRWIALCGTVWLGLALSSVTAATAQAGSGQVVDQDGEGIAGATVTFRPGGASGNTNGRGRFQIAGLEDGVYTVFVKPRGAPAKQFAGVKIEGGRLTGALVVEVAREPPQQEATGRVVDRDGADQAGAEVRFGGQQPIFTNSRGTFKFVGPAGTYQVTVTAKNGLTASKTVEVANNSLNPDELVVQ